MAENKINQAELDEKQLNEEKLDKVDGGIGGLTMVRKWYKKHFV